MSTVAQKARAFGPVWGRGALVFAGLASFVALAHLDVSICPFANLTGHPCPGCGLTRAAFALLTLDFRAAFALHPLSPLLVPLVGWFAFDGARRFVTQQPAAGPTLGARASAIGFGLLSVALISVWMARFFGWFGGPVAVSGFFMR